MMESKYPTYPKYKNSGTEWLGDIPSEWGLFDGKRLFSNRRELSLETDEQLAASQKYGVVPQSLMMKLNDSKVMLALKGTSSFRHVEKNDFVISLRSFEGGIEHSRYIGCVSPAYTVLSATKKVAPNFYRYLFKSNPFIAALQSTTDSLRDGKSITFDQFGAIPLVVPQQEEQQKITNFLDYETAKIDILIEKQQRLIKLLKEKREAVISHAVTKGLNPDVPMRNSGVEWLGEVPEHWVSSELKYYARVLDCKHITAKFCDEGVPLASIGEVKERVVNLTTAKLTSEKYYLDLIDGDRKPSAGDIIYSRNATVGEAALVPANMPKFAMGQDVCLIRPDKGILPEYLLYVLESGVISNQLELAMVGSTFKRINVDNIRNFYAAWPCYGEQIEIVSEIDRILGKYGALILRAEATVDLIQERRTALISAAVTGKIDVRNWQAPEPTTNDLQQAAS